MLKSNQCTCKSHKIYSVQVQIKYNPRNPWINHKYFHQCLRAFSPWVLIFDKRMYWVDLAKKNVSNLIKISRIKVENPVNQIIPCQSCLNLRELFREFLSKKLLLFPGLLKGLYSKSCLPMFLTNKELGKMLLEVNICGATCCLGSQTFFVGIVTVESLWTVFCMQFKI